MFARISRYKMKPESIADAEAKLQRLMPTIMRMDGMVAFTSAVDADGNGVIVSVVESEEKSDANREQVEGLWAQFRGFLMEEPEIAGYRVVVHESN